MWVEGRVAMYFFGVFIDLFELFCDLVGGFFWV